MVGSVSRVVSSWRSKKFVWGVTDCARFANDAVVAMTGKPALAEKQLVFESSDDLERHYPGWELRELFQEILTKAGMELVDVPEGEAIAVVKLGPVTPALAVWDGEKLWMISAKGLREVDPLLVVEWWQSKTEKDHG